MRLTNKQKKINSNNRCYSFINNDVKNILDLVIAYKNDAEIIGLDEVTKFNCQGIYLLVKAKEVVYVGQTDNVFRRLGQHYDSEKDFKRVVFISSKSDLNKYEEFLIKCFIPKYNVSLKNISPIEIREYLPKGYSKHKSVNPAIESHFKIFSKRAKEYYDEINN